jgi:hypothetical protein
MGHAPFVESLWQPLNSYWRIQLLSSDDIMSYEVAYHKHARDAHGPQ